MDTVELYHHGIKGQKWGVRRFQKKDGTLTAAGKKRYNDSDGSNDSASDKPKKFKVTHRMVLEKKYRDQGLSEEEAKAAADKRIKVEKVVAVAAGVTVAACTAYYLKNKISSDWCDQTLKAGTTFHNLDSTANPRPGEHLYVNYRQNDVNYFRGHFAINKMRQTGHVFNHTLTATEDIKIPSLNTRKSVFKELYNKDEDFRRIFNMYGGEGSTAKNPAKVYKNMWANFGDKDNAAFNTAKRKYFEALRQKGYEAIVDEWDTSKRVFRSDAPLILLNTSSKSFGEMSINELTKRDILLSQANSKHYRFSRDVLTSLGTPHTNHFAESSKQLSRYAAKSAKNASNLDRVLASLSDEDLAKYTRHERGSTLAKAGELLSKNSNLDVNQAISNAYLHSTVAEGAKALTGFGIMFAPAIGVSTAANEYKTRKYMEEHPNTKLTYNQIKASQNYSKVVQDYIEKHPNTHLSAAKIMQMYYSGKIK